MGIIVLGTTQQSISYWTHFRDSDGIIKPKGENVPIVKPLGKNNKSLKNQRVVSAAPPSPSLKEDKAVTESDSKKSSATSSSEEKAEVREEKLSPHARKISDMYTFSFPTKNGVYVIPPLPKGVARQLRSKFIPSDRSTVYFVGDEFIGNYSSLVHHLGIYGLRGVFDLTPLLRDLTAYLPTCVGINYDSTLTGSEAAAIFVDVLSNYDYVESDLEAEATKITKPEVQEVVRSSEDFSRFDFRHDVKDQADLDIKTVQLAKLVEDDPSRRPMVANWIQRQKEVLASGDRKLSTIKESFRRGAPGYSRVN